MPKAKPYPDDRGPPADSPWEDEASTTVEQGEVAEKVRTLGFAKQHNTNLTHTGTGIDEPTVDDQHAPVLSAITPIRPELAARLIITQGNDAGQEIEIHTSKTYTVGRALDNDVVLTDIAVSRKHFDLRFEDGAWIVVDRGSGNGTVVNGNVEDNPFMLAAGDVIEIGNTVFRFEQDDVEPRPSQNNTFDVDDEEMSTVAGKPVRAEPEDDPPPPPPQRPQRPKTLPPPVPLRHASPSSAPPPSQSVPPPLASYEPANNLPPLPASTLPMPQMANRPPLGAPHAPTMLGDAMGMPMQQQMHQQPYGYQQPFQPDVPMNGLGSPMTGQGPAARPSYPYPQATEIPPHSVHAQLLQIHSQNRRGDGSTAHVSPQPYDPMYHMVARPAPSLSRRTKLAIAGIALALLTGIVTAAVVKSSSPAKGKAGVSASSTKTSKSSKKTDSKTAKVEATPIDKQPTVEPIVDAPKETPKEEPPKEQPVIAEAPKEEPAKQDPPKDEEPEIIRETPTSTKKATTSTKKTTTTTKKSTPPPRETTRRDPPPTRVAAAVDTSGARDRADSLYRDRKFSEAAKILASAAKSASGDEADELRDRSKKLSLLAKAYAKGTAPAEKPTAAFSALQQALNYDNNLGGNFKSELNEKLAAIAPKAAVAFAAAKDYPNARTAYLAAQRAGSNDSNLPIVKQKLENHASELYNAAAAEASSNPGPAKEKLKQVKMLVDAKSPIAVKAQALYNKL